MFSETLPFYLKYSVVTAFCGTAKNKKNKENPDAFVQ